MKSFAKILHSAYMSNFAGLLLWRYRSLDSEYIYRIRDIGIDGDGLVKGARTSYRGIFRGDGALFSGQHRFACVTGCGTSARCRHTLYDKRAFTGICKFKPGGYRTKLFLNGAEIMFRARKGHLRLLLGKKPAAQ